MRTLLLALQIAAAEPPARTPPLPPRDSVTLRARVDGAVLEFLRAWRSDWQDSQQEHAARASGDYVRDNDERGLALHCHWDMISMRVRHYMIRGTVVAHATCPRLYPAEAPKLDDERRGIDGGLAPTRRWRIQGLRYRLRLLLDSAAGQLPGDVHITGQRVRFAIDAGDVAGAARAAIACDRDHAQCGLIQGLEFEVRTIKVDEPNLAQRLGRIFRLGDPPGASVGVRWRETPENSCAIHRMEGSVPLQMRSIVVDVSRLARGKYRLQVSTNVPGGAAVTSERALELR